MQFDMATPMRSRMNRLQSQTVNCIELKYADMDVIDKGIQGRL